jgi:hypothetical protein
MTDSRPFGQAFLPPSPQVLRAPGPALGSEQSWARPVASEVNGGSSCAHRHTKSWGPMGGAGALERLCLQGEVWPRREGGGNLEVEKRVLQARGEWCSSDPCYFHVICNPEGPLLGVTWSASQLGLWMEVQLWWAPKALCIGYIWLETSSVALCRAHFQG